MSSILTNTQPSQSEPITQTASEVSFMELLNEIQKTPREYWFHLFQILHAFRETVTLKPEQFTSVENKTEAGSQESEILVNQHEALKALTKQWMEEGDETEQTETWEYLCQALAEDSVKI